MNFLTSFNLKKRTAESTTLSTLPTLPTLPTQVKTEQPDQFVLTTLPPNDRSRLERMSLENASFSRRRRDAPAEDKKLLYSCITSVDGKPRDSEPLYFLHHFLDDTDLGTNYLYASKTRTTWPVNTELQVTFCGADELRCGVADKVVLFLSMLSGDVCPTPVQPEKLGESLIYFLSKHPLHMDETFVFKLHDLFFGAKVQELHQGQSRRAGQAMFDDLQTKIEVVWQPETLTRVKFANDQFGHLMSLMDTSMNFTDLGIGGLNQELGQIFRRAFVSRLFNKQMSDIGCKHVKGILLYGPPGTGKTLIARKIGEMLKCSDPKIVNGPELLSKYVGESEQNIRKLFADAYNSDPSDNTLHLVIFDEIDAICQNRGSSGDSTGVKSSIVTQLLALMDGVKSINNILIIGMTNRKDLLDDALLRPGRLEIHIKISLPDEKGRLEILKIHTKKLIQNHFLSDDVNLEELSRMTNNFTGAELEGLVRSAVSFAMISHVKIEEKNASASTNCSSTSTNTSTNSSSSTYRIEPDNLVVTKIHFDLALQEIRPAFGMPREDWDSYQRGGLIDYPYVCNSQNKFNQQYGNNFNSSHPQVWLPWLNKTNHNLSMRSLLIHGPHGTGCTAFSSFLARHGPPSFCVKWLSAAKYIGASEYMKAQVLKEAFADAFTCDQSLIVIDNMEAWINYISPARFSSLLYQCLEELCRQTPPTGKCCTLVCTTHEPEWFHQSGWFSIFTCFHELFQIEQAWPWVKQRFPSIGDDFGFPTTITHLVNSFPVVAENVMMDGSTRDL
jgi:SpoVK/Ycf46/Vps4 family AAA+-type ATPase